MENKTFKTVGHPVRKKDAMSFLLGMPVYTDDITPSDCLTVKVLRSPYAHALIEEIDISTAMKVPGIECILTYKDVPQNRFTNLLRMTDLYSIRGLDLSGTQWQLLPATVKNR